MADRNKIQICFESKTRLMKVLSIIERDNDDLVAIPQRAEFYREYGTTTDNKTGIKHQKYSIHCSPNSTEGVNCLVHTLTFGDGSEKRTRLYTKAMKLSNLFVPIYIARCMDLDKPSYEPNPDEDVIKIGAYNPRKNTLYYMIVVGNEGENFDKFKMKDINKRSFQFDKFSLTVFWSFQYLTSHNTGAKSHVYTMSRDDEDYIETNTEDGFSKDQIIDIFKITRQRLFDEFIKILNQEGKDDPEFLETLKVASKFKFSKDNLR